MVFPNPLGWKKINDQATLIHPHKDLDQRCSELKKLFNITRTTDTDSYTFGCYQHSEDAPAGLTVKDVENPFPVPADRSRKTQQRGRFSLPFTLPS
mgnify:CR=1 FL=1